MEQIANETTEEFILRVGRQLCKGTNRRPLAQYNLLHLGFEVYLHSAKRGVAAGMTIEGSDFPEWRLRICFDRLSKAMDILEEEP